MKKSKQLIAVMLGCTILLCGASTVKAESLNPNIYHSCPACGELNCSSGIGFRYCSKCTSSVAIKYRCLKCNSPYDYCSNGHLY